MKELRGDVFKAKEDILIHGCNCFCKMGSGVAKTVREIYPEAWEADQKTIRGDESKLGTYTFWGGRHYYYNQPITVINLYSQYNYNRRKINADYDAIEKGLKKLAFVCNGSSIAMPRIGAGLAGGDWDIIKKIINDAFGEQIVKVYSI